MVPLEIPDGLVNDADGVGIRDGTLGPGTGGDVGAEDAPQTYAADVNGLLHSTPTGAGCDVLLVGLEDLDELADEAELVGQPVVVLGAVEEEALRGLPRGEVSRRRNRRRREGRGVLVHWSTSNLRLGRHQALVLGRAVLRSLQIVSMLEALLHRSLGLGRWN